MVKEKTVIVTGSQGFIGSYVCEILLSNGYFVVGIDNFSKYGYVQREHDAHVNFKLFVGDVQQILSTKLMNKIEPNYIIASAAMIGGISYFHKYAYDLLAENERITAATFDYAIQQYKKGCLKKIINISSSMVFESTDTFPTTEKDIYSCRLPLSTYGFQKLSTEFFCKGAFEQYGLPYSIVRPFNCVGVGENETTEQEACSGNQKMMLSHVIPDIIRRALLLGPVDTFPIYGSGEQIRCYTNGKDIGNAIKIILESEKSTGESFNISHPIPTTVKHLVSIVYRLLYNKKCTGFDYLPSFEYDVQKRIPDVTKAKELLGISCDIPVENSIKEVIEWIVKK